jgi:hypothetical protein
VSEGVTCTDELNDLDICAPLSDHEELPVLLAGLDEQRPVVPSHHANAPQLLHCRKLKGPLLSADQEERPLQPAELAEGRPLLPINQTADSPVPLNERPVLLTDKPVDVELINPLAGQKDEWSQDAVSENRSSVSAKRTVLQISTHVSEELERFGESKAIELLSQLLPGLHSKPQLSKKETNISEVHPSNTVGVRTAGFLVEPWSDNACSDNVHPGNSSGADASCQLQPLNDGGFSSSLDFKSQKTNLDSEADTRSQEALPELREVRQQHQADRCQELSPDHQELGYKVISDRQLYRSQELSPDHQEFGDKGIAGHRINRSQEINTESQVSPDHLSVHEKALLLPGSETRSQEQIDKNSAVEVLSAGCFDLPADKERKTNKDVVGPLKGINGQCLS